MVTHDQTSNVGKLPVQLHSAPTAACQAEWQAVLWFSSKINNIHQQMIKKKHGYNLLTNINNTTQVQLFSFQTGHNYIFCI